VVLDERLRRTFEVAGEPADPSGVYEDLIRRRERRRMARGMTLGVVSVAVVAACIVGIVILSRVFTPTESRPGADGGVAPSVQPVPTPADVAPTGKDIGLGFPVCNVSTIEGPFASPDTNATISVATKAGDLGGCPQPDGAFNVVTLDTDQDGVADASFGPIECTIECRTFSAPDLDADGTAELLIVQSGGSILGLGLFDVDVRESEPVLEPMTVASPGDPAGGFEPGEVVRLLLGGDEFYLDTLRCGDPEMRHGPGLIVTTAESLPHDSPDARWHAHTTVFALVDGSLQVMDIGDFTEPAGVEAPSFQSGETLCGSNLGP
jgi:hypothetical protein